MYSPFLWNKLSFIIKSIKAVPHLKKRKQKTPVQFDFCVISYNIFLKFYSSLFFTCLYLYFSFIHFMYFGMLLCVFEATYNLHMTLVSIIIIVIILDLADDRTAFITKYV